MYKNGEDNYVIIVRLLKYLKTNFSFSPKIIEKINNYLSGKEFKNDTEFNSIISCLPGPLFKDSIANNKELLSEWDYERNILQPKQISLGSKEKISWKCLKGHKWKATPDSRKRGRGCPFCKGKQPTKENNLAVINS